MLPLSGALLLFVCLLVVFGTLAWGALSAAPWVPLPRRDVERLISCVDPQPGELLVDLGCGDGRLLVAAAARPGVRAIGYEVAVVPYLLAQLRRVLSPARERISVRYQSFWEQDLGTAAAVVCFLTPPAMRRLEPKLDRELRPGARFATYVFPLPNATRDLVDKPTRAAVSIYRYRGPISGG